MKPSNTTTHGGSLQKGRRKTRRPLSSKKPIHLVLKARKNNLYQNKKILHEQIQKFQKRFEIKIYSSAVHFDHVHLLIQVKGRASYNAFVRSLSVEVAKKLGAGIWKLPPFTRMAEWGREFHRLWRYLQKNRVEVHERATVEWVNSRL